MIKKQRVKSKFDGWNGTTWIVGWLMEHVIKYKHIYTQAKRGNNWTKINYEIILIKIKNDVVLNEYSLIYPIHCKN